ncbi:MAG: PEP-CTERM sorting domain-containing protein [Phycisphaerales bacterium]|nr:PEP-CTERM sorting domain-containing protein [Phycisphaerales bacterium]
MVRSSVLALIASAGVVSFPAAADVIVTFGFTDLAGAYSGGVFTTNDDADSSGDVTRLEAPITSADYNVGFSGGTAAVTTSVSVFGILGNTASGAGSFSITDADGDVLTGTITGTWIGSGLGIFFNGDLSGVVFDGTNGDGQFFDGPDGGSFDYTTLSGIPPYEGAIVQLFVPVAGFFTSDFNVESVQVSGEIVPAPGAIALLGLGGLLAARRRRA